MPQVKIRIEKGVATAGDGQEQQEKEAEKSLNKKVAVMSLFAHQMLGNVKQIMNMSISHIGDWSGNYIRQANINGKLEQLETASGFATAMVTSIATENPIPIILQTMSFGVKTGLTLYEDYKKQIKATRDSDFLLSRSGNGTTNGSRGTEN